MDRSYPIIARSIILFRDRAVPILYYICYDQIILTYHTHMVTIHFYYIHYGRSAFRISCNQR